MGVWKVPERMWVGGWSELVRSAEERGFSFKPPANRGPRRRKAGV